jgi:mono/diheme cytochrome c family protein
VGLRLGILAAVVVAAVVPVVVVSRGGSTSAAEVAKGKRLVGELGCLNCHTNGGAGAQALGAPDLTREGLRRRGTSWQVRHLECPACVVPGSAMPSFKPLGGEDLDAIATFLEAATADV